ncbi:hypothetical protein OO013_09880 [Mangrovivirga sp. M17]|uniref:DUF4468 domain-containing protein n=1 Tax=Mangrovivirga halotolerans TaxID=2993936 RepID=A0ABT3RSQ3_9BACT|nr:hypothetical protein [Mangrovivirga halotolerans]MCX2744175.1 hypothetical protein [Mangrovivirga halotolerans]
MKILRAFLFFTAFLVSLSAYGQKIKVDGDLDKLTEYSQIKIEYYYEDMSVGKFDNEEEYIEEKVTKYNEDEPGKGDEWKENWYNDRAERYHPKFLELINKYLEKSDVSADHKGEAPVTMKVYTTFTEPGWNVGVMRKSAMIDLRIEFYANNELIAEMEVLKAPGAGAMGYDFDAGLRISEAYAKAGKEVGKYLTKKVW